MNNRAMLGEEIEIDLIQLIRDLLVQWKAIVCIMIVFGLITPAAMLAWNTHSYNKNLESDKLLQDKLFAAKENGKINTDKLYGQLTAAEQVTLDSAILKWDSLNTRMDYVEDSLYMNIDPAKTRKLYVQYTVSADAAYLSTAVDMYLSATEDNAFLIGVKDVFNNYLDNETKIRYVRELISTSSGGGPTGMADKGTTRFTVIVMLPNDITDATAVTEAVRDYMESRNDYVTANVGSHSLKYIKFEEQVTDDQTLLSYQNDTKLAVQNYQTELNNITASMSALQKQIYKGRTGADLTTPEDYNLDTDDDGILDVMDINLNGIDDATEPFNFDTDGDGEPDTWDLNENGIDDTIETEHFKPHFSLKFAIVGLLVGAVLYCGWYLLMMILVPMIRTGEELSNLTGIKNFGVLRNEPEKYGLYNDKFFFKLLYHAKKSSAEELVATAERLGIYAKYHEMDSITLLTADPKSEKDVKKLYDALSSKGLNVSTVALYDGDKMTDLAESKMIESDNFLLCLMPGATKIKDLSTALGVASEYDKKVVGTVTF